MKIISKILIFAIIGVFFAIPAMAGWRAVIQAEGADLGGVYKNRVTIGVDTQAETVPSPPAPPSYSCDMKIVSPDFSSFHAVDIRQEGAAEYCHILAVNPSGNIGPPAERTVRITWNPAEFGDGNYVLREGYECNGPLLVDDMKQTTAYDLKGENKDYYFTITVNSGAGAPVVADPGDNNQNPPPETPPQEPSADTPSETPSDPPESTDPDDPEYDGLSYRFDFSTPGQWTGGFSDYPSGQEAYYGLSWAEKSLPENLQTGSSQKQAIFITGNNHSADLFMFIKTRLAGLKPETLYRLTFNVTFATNAPSGCVGVGGAPGENVWIKAGASIPEPIAMETGDYYLMNVDKGNQATGGENARVLGNIAGSNTDCANTAYEFKTLGNTESPLETKTDQDGSLWVFVGADSGFESVTGLYFANVEVQAEPVEANPSENPEDNAPNSPETGEPSTDDGDPGESYEKEIIVLPNPENQDSQPSSDPPVANDPENTPEEPANSGEEPAGPNDTMPVVDADSDDDDGVCFVSSMF